MHVDAHGDVDNLPHEIEKEKKKTNLLSYFVSFAQDNPGAKLGTMHLILLVRGAFTHLGLPMVYSPAMLRLSSNSMRAAAMVARAPPREWPAKNSLRFLPSSL